MKHTWFQRMLSTLLALVLVLGYVPVNARAEEHVPSEDDYTNAAADAATVPSEEQPEEDFPPEPDAASILAAELPSAMASLPDIVLPEGSCSGCGWSYAQCYSVTSGASNWRQSSSLPVQYPDRHVWWCAMGSRETYRELHNMDGANGECTVCGYLHTHKAGTQWSYDADNHWHKCSFTPCEERIDEASHTEVVDSAKEPTCTETGLTEGSHCSVCGMIILEQEVVPAAHKFENGSCVFCGMRGGTCGENLSWALTDGTLTVSGTGEMTDYFVFSDAPWKAYCSQIKCVVVNEGVTSIGSWAFFDCSSLESITIPEGVTSIGGCAFLGCSSLESITLPDSLTSIGSSAFNGCSSLKSITLPDSLTSIDSSAFAGCSSLKEITFIGNAPSFGAGAFGSVTATSFYPEGDETWTEDKRQAYGGAITWLPYLAKGSCGENMNWFLTDGVLTVSGTGNMGSYADQSATPWHQNSADIQRIVIAEGITSVGDYAFDGCQNLTQVTLPASLCSVGSNAFRSCTALTDVYYASNKLHWNQISVSAQNDPLLSATIHYTDLCSEGHTKVIDAAKEPTCTETGLTEGSHCSVCGKIILEQEVVPAAHKFENGICVFCGVRGGACGDGLTWSLTADGTLTISGTGKMTNYSNSSSAPWYAYRYQIKCVVVNEGVTSIGDSAFRVCTSLESITIPGSVTSIGDNAFYNCISLESITIPEGVTSIGIYAFYRCTSLTSVTIEEGVTSIDSSAFYGCSSLESVTIPGSVTSIGDSAFWGCSSLESVTIPGSVTSIGKYAFLGCSSLINITVAEDNPNYCDMNGVLFNKSKTTLLLYPAAKEETSYTIAEGVTSIGYYAFYYCSSLTSVTIEEGVTSIGDCAFSGCSSLKEITFIGNAPSFGTSVFGSVTATSFYPEGDETWTEDKRQAYGGAITWLPYSAKGSCGDDLTWSLTADGTLTISGTGEMTNYSNSSSAPWYAYCSQIKCVVVNEGVTSIGDRAFFWCTSLTSITIPGSVTSIGDNAFHGCSSLKSITLPDSLTSIGKFAFYDCRSLESITIPGSVTSIGGYAFYWCTSLTSVTIEEGVPSIDDFAFYGCSSLESVTIGEGVTSIGEYAFFNCSSLESITLPDSLTSIGYSAFYYCSSLESITIPEGVTSIDSYAFYGCSSLESITIPGSVTSIGYKAFYGCSSLTSVTIEEGVTSIDSSAFYGCSSLKSITLPDSLTRIDHSVFSGCSSLINITVAEDNPNYCDMNGVLFNKSKTTLLSYPAAKEETSYTIAEGVTRIGESAFYGCSSLESITIPEGVTSIGEYAFSGCSSLKEITFIGNAPSFGTGVFGSVTATSFYPERDETWTEDKRQAYGGAITWLPYLAKGTCGENLSWALTDGTLTVSGSGAMTDYSQDNISPWYDWHDSIKNLILEEGLTTIGNHAFMDCTNLSSVNIPHGVTKIGNLAFGNCTSLADIFIPDTVIRIDSAAFSGCSELREIIFDGNAPEIQEDSFFGVSATAYYPSGNETWTSETRQNYGGTITWLTSGILLRSLELDKSYVTLPVHDSLTLNAAVDSDIPVELCWSVEDKTIATVSEDGTVTAQNAGTTYVIVSMAAGDVTLSARCRVDVTAEPSKIAVTGVHLGTTSLTTELFKTDYAEFDVILGLSNNLSDAATSQSADDPAEPESGGVAITSAKFADAATDAVFGLAVKDDRTLQVVPKPEAIDNPKTVAGKYSSPVTVTVDGKEFTTDTALSLKVKKTLPKLKAETVTFNTFYIFYNPSQLIRFSGGEVTEVRRNTAMDTAKTTAVPDWLTLKGGVLTIDPKYTAKSAKVYVTAKAEGWAKGVDVTVPVKVVYEPPKLKLSAKTVTFAVQNGISTGVKLQLLSGDRKVSLADLNIKSISSLDGFYATKVDSDGYFTLYPNGKVTPGPITLQVKFTDSIRSVPLGLDVKVQDVSLKLKTSTVTLNSDLRDTALIPVTVTPADYKISDISDKVIFELTDSSGKPVGEGELGYDLENLPPDSPSVLLAVMCGPNVKPNATYKLSFWVKDSGKKTTLTVKTQPKGEEVIVSLKTSGAIDPTNTTSAVQVKHTFKNHSCHSALFDGYTVTAYEAGDTDGVDASGLFDIDYFLWNDEPEINSSEDTVSSLEQLYVWATDYSAIDPSLTYKMKLVYELRDGTTTTSSEVVLPVKHTPNRLKLSKTSLSLNKAVNDKAVLDLTCLIKGYELTDVVLPSEYTGDNAPLNVSFAGGKLTVEVNSNTQYGETYKIPIQATKYDPAVTLTVKIPAEDKSAVTASLKAKGAIDTVRDGTFITVTPSYKNYMGLSNINLNLTIESWSGKKGEDYQPVEEFYEGNPFDIQQEADGTYTIKKVPGASLYTDLKYRAKLTFGDETLGYVNLTIKTGTGRYTVTGTPVLYKLDRFSSDTFTVTTTDTTLNEIEMVWFKNDAHEEMLWLQKTAPGEFAIIFRNSKVPTENVPTSIPLEVWCEGGDKPVATVTLKLQVR